MDTKKVLGQFLLLMGVWSTAAVAGSPGRPSVAYAPDGGMVAVLHNDPWPAGIQIRNAGSLAELDFIEIQSNLMHDLDFSPDGRLLACTGRWACYCGMFTAYRRYKRGYG